MKKLAFMLFGASLLFVAGCKKESTDDGSGDSGALVVEKRQRSMVGYVTATWCGPCGAYGGPNFKKALDEVGEENITMLNIHTSSSKLTPYFKRPTSMNNTDSVYISPVFQGIFNSLNIPTTSTGGISIPSFSMNGGYMGTSNVTSEQVKNNAVAHNEYDPQIGVAARKKITGNTISVDIKTETYEELNGEYFVTALVLEDKVMGLQTGAPDPINTEHRNVVRACMNGGGEMYNQKMFDDMPFASGTVSAGSEYSTTINLNYQRYTAANINPVFGLVEWDMAPANTKIAVIVWAKFDDTKYIYINSVVAK